MDKPEPDDALPLDKPDPGDLPPIGSSEFHDIAQKQILNAVFTALADNKMEWASIAPFLEAAREVCAGDFAANARVRLHTTRAEGESWVEAEEAFLGISVADRDEGQEWLSETYWLSDIATADGSRAQVTAIIAALERTIAKLQAWLKNGTGGPAEAKPPEAES